ncbi:MAG: hypothetical protein AB7T10_09855 [bacterium]
MKTENYSLGESSELCGHILPPFYRHAELRTAYLYSEASVKKCSFLQPPSPLVQKEFIFDGGFKIKFDYLNTLTATNINQMVDSLRKDLTLVRNAIVHIREKRQNCGIVNNEINNNSIYPIYCILKRVVEFVMINHESLD